MICDGCEKGWRTVTVKLYLATDAEEEAFTAAVSRLAHAYSDGKHGERIEVDGDDCGSDERTCTEEARADEDEAARERSEGR